MGGVRRVLLGIVGRYKVNQARWKERVHKIIEIELELPSLLLKLEDLLEFESLGFVLD